MTYSLKDIIVYLDEMTNLSIEQIHDLVQGLEDFYDDTEILLCLEEDEKSYKLIPTDA